MNCWSIHFVFNFIEGIWWIGSGVWITWYYEGLKWSTTTPSCSETSECRIPGSSPGQALSGMTKKRSTKAYGILLAIILILFGISDFVEMATGAWWQPWWLLAWKGLCVAVGIILIIFIFNERKSR